MTRIRRTSILLLTLLVALSCTGTAAADERAARSQAVLAYQHDLIATLSRGNHRQALIGAALLARSIPASNPRLGFHALIKRAAATAPQAAAVRWLQLGDCAAAALNCPNPQALGRLEQVAPDNAAVWLVALGVAVQRNDEAGARHALQMASQARHYDDYAGQSLQALAAAVADVPPPASLHAAGLSTQGTGALLVFALGRAQPRPALPTTARWCRDHRQDSPWRDRCLRLATVLVQAGSPLARSLGLYLRQTLDGDPASRAQVASDRRTLVWQVQQFDRLASQADRDDTVARTLLELARDGGPELTLMRHALLRMGIPLEPPRQWSPSAAHGRS